MRYAVTAFEHVVRRICIDPRPGERTFVDEREDSSEHRYMATDCKTGCEDYKEFKDFNDAWLRCLELESKSETV